jgi:hypothetical protein
MCIFAGSWSYSCQYIIYYHFPLNSNSFTSSRCPLFHAVLISRDFDSRLKNGQMICLAIS